MKLTNRRRTLVRPAAVLLALAVLSVPLHASPNDPEDQPERSQERQGSLRDRFRQRLGSILEDLRADTKALEEIVARMDKGESFEDVRHLIPDRLASRFRPQGDGPDGEYGPRRERGGEGGRGEGRGGYGERGGFNARNDQPFSDDDWQAVNAIITHAQPEMLPKFKELRERDAEQAQRLTLAAYPRLRPLLDLYKHDRAAFDLRLEEMAIVRESLPLAKEVLDLRRAGKAEDSPEVKAAREKLRELARRQVVNRIAIQRSDLEAMRKRLERREKELAASAADPEAGVESSIDMLIKQAERGGKDGPGEGRGRGPGGPPGTPPGGPGSPDERPLPGEGERHARPRD